MLVHTTAPTTHTHTHTHTSTKYLYKHKALASPQSTDSSPKKLVTPSFLTRETLFVGKFADMYVQVAVQSTRVAPGA
jgi:acetoacetate decarboxylase